MVTLRVFLHAALIALALAIIAAVLGDNEFPLVRTLLSWLSPGHFLIFSLTVAALLNRRSRLLFLLFGLGLLVCFDIVTQRPVSFLFAICLGVTTAGLVHALRTEATGDDT